MGVQVEPVEEAVEHRRKHHGDGREERDPAEQGVATGEQLAALVPEGEILYLCRLKDEGVLFYYGRPAQRFSGSDAPSHSCFLLLLGEEWQTGPYRNKGGFDLIAQGFSGLMSITGEPWRPPAKTGVPLTDLGAGLFTLVGILAAVHYRSRTGVGQHVDTSLVEAGIALSIWEATEYFSGAGIPAPLGSAHRMTAPYQAIRCADGYITIGAGNDRLFRRFCELLGCPDWSNAPEFADNSNRVRNKAALAAQIEEITVRKPRDHWLALLESNDIPCGPINNYAEVFADPHIVAREMILETDHPVLGRLKTLGSPIKLSATPPNPRRRAPLLGEHTDEVLAQMGFSSTEIQALRQLGAIR